MPRAMTCPDLSQYQRLAAGQLADGEKEALLKHLEGCDACAARLNALPEQDTLVGLIRLGQTLGDGQSRETIARLVERLSKLRPAQPVALTFACPACGKRLKTKGELAGKKVQCPQCKQAVQAPVSGISAPAASSPSGPGSVVALPLNSRVNAAGKPGNTIDYRPSGADDRELYAFLAPPQAPDELGRLGPYRVLQVLGAGGMGVVFRAEDPQLARLVALKAMLPALAANPRARQRFLQEARAAAAIKHDHIVTIYQVGEDRGVPFLAMDFLEGESLDARVERAYRGEKTSPLPVAEVLRVGREIALGLAAAHKRGLVHRDIKPANIWLEAGTGRVKILDFGLARTVAQDDQLTQDGAIVGTPGFMAPEQAQGMSVDHRCDLFSLGCVLYRLATGKQPFGGTDTISRLFALASETPRPPHDLEPGLPPALSEIIMNLLAKEPENRPSSAQAVAETLERIAMARVVSPMTRSKPPARLSPPALRTAPLFRKKWPIIAGAAACLLLAMLAILAAGGAFRLKTEDGTIVVENLPADAEVFVDGKKVSVKLTGDDKPIAIQVAPGKRTLAISATGFKMETREVTLTSGERSKPIDIRLEPLAAASEKPAALPAEITNGIGMKLRLVKPGTFLMGSPKEEQGREYNEGPQHEVEITKAFYMGAYPVTKDQFAAFVEEDGYRTDAEKDGGGLKAWNVARARWEQKPEYNWRNPGFSQGDDHPVVGLCWNDATAFCTWLSKKEGKLYELPTEAEWEYACRAGTTTRFWCGDTDASLQGNANIADASLESKADSDARKNWSFVPWNDGFPLTSPVGSFKPNPWGLYDMGGNVNQWCSDWCGPYREKAIKDPKDESIGHGRALRGGSWYGEPRICRSAFRGDVHPALCINDVGLRVVLRIPVGQ